MRARARDCAAAGALFASLLACALWISACGPTDTNSEASTWTGAEAGLDPQAFTSAKALYHAAATRPSDSSVAQSVATVSQRLDAGAQLESAQVWDLLIALEPYRGSIEVQQAASRWSKVVAGRIDRNAKPPDTSAVNTVRQAGNLYIQNNLQGASALYRQVLTQWPGNIDVRNNLALAEVHIDHDLVAQIELEAVIRAVPKYIPALVNLTSVYERAGRREAAKEMADRAIAESRDIPATVYNVAWFANLEGDYRRAEELLQPWEGLSGRPRYARLLELTRQQRGAPSRAASTVSGSDALSGPDAFWRMGLARKLGWWTSTAMRALCVVGFLVGGIIIAAISGGLGARVSSGAGCLAFLLFLVLGGAWYIAAWGIPAGGWWALFAAYLLVAGTITGAVADT